jgi:hypothetical protein
VVVVLIICLIDRILKGAAKKTGAETFIIYDKNCLRDLTNIILNLA